MISLGDYKKCIFRFVKPAKKDTDESKKTFFATEVEFSCMLLYLKDTLKALDNFKKKQKSV